jgi:hypothetical protein
LAIHTQAREQLERLEREPFVARVVVRWEDEDPPREETIYVSRASVADVASAVPEVKVVTYGAPLGRLAEYGAGESAILKIGPREREVSLLERVTLRPKISNGEWDAIEGFLEFGPWDVSVESVRRLLEQLSREVTVSEEAIPDILGALLGEAEADSLFRAAARRQVIGRMALRDQPTLDRYQGEVFRLPLDRRLVLLGPPGTGKTTTLIKRLAQKRTRESLTDEELQALSTAGLEGTFLYAHSWAMFSPSELLKLYLRDAFNREGVPASDANIKTWEKERLDLGKNVLRILRSADSGRFQLDERAGTLSDPSSAGLSRLHEEFATHLEAEVINGFTDALDQLQRADDEELSQLVRKVVGRRSGVSRFTIRDVASMLDDTTQLQPEMRRLDALTKKELRDLSNRLIHNHKNLLDELAEALPTIVGDETKGDEEEEDEPEDAPPMRSAEPKSREEKRRVAAEVLEAALRSSARAAALGRSTIGGRAGRVVEYLGDRLPSKESLTQVGTRIVTRARLRSLIQAPRLFVMGAPQFYNRFRRRALKESRLFKPGANDAVRQGRISPDETDVIILTMLRNARRLLEENPSHLVQPSSQDWLEEIKSQYLMQVFVDEATDFSPVQLACTMELAHPRLRSWFACGDFNQRITSYGIRDISELGSLEREVADTIEVREVSTGYRQSRRLRELAIALTLTGATAGQTLRAPDRGEDADVLPLLAENYTGGYLAGWLSDRIVEVERSIGKLPSIAIFVDSEEKIDPLVNLLQPLLGRRNIPVVGCKDGRVVGDDLEVRVFDIRHIKGLEFEAVFFVGIDRLAERFPDLFDRFFYVGASRAATYLGVTCDGTLPANLESVREHFGTGSWEV